MLSVDPHFDSNLIIAFRRSFGLPIILECDVFQLSISALEPVKVFEIFVGLMETVPVWTIVNWLSQISICDFQVELVDLFE